jgi:HEAT repeat protein
MEHKLKKTETLDSLYGSQKSEVRSQKSEVRSQKSEDRSQKSEVRNQKSEVRSHLFPLFSVLCPLSYVFCVQALLFAYLAVFIFGCDELLQTTSGDFNVADISTPWAKALRIIQEGLADNDPLVRVRALEVVADTGQIRLMPAVHQLLNDKSMPVRFAAALAVGDLEYSPSKSSISQLLKDSDANVTTAAAYAMFKLGSANYLEALRNAIASSDQTVRANAALLLGKSGDKSSLELLWRAMQSKDSDDMVIYQSAEAIAMLKDEKIYPRLWTMLISAYADVRLMGVGAMGKLGTPDAKNALIRMLDDDILEIRLVAAEQLGVFKDPIGESKVLEVFEKNLTSGLDMEAGERANVLTALAIGQICTPALTKFLPQLLQNESKFVRIAAAKAVLQCTK